MADMPQQFTYNELQDQIDSLRKRKLKSKMEAVQSEIRDAERTQDEDKIVKLTQKILELKRQG